MQNAKGNKNANWKAVMNKRVVDNRGIVLKFLSSTACGSFLIWNTASARAATTFENGAWSAYIPVNKLPGIQPQQTLVWCWAASAQTIFRYYGYEVDQTAIVVGATGVVAITAANAPIMVNMLNRSYVAADGRSFRVHTPRIYDALAWQAGDPTYWQRLGIAPLDNPRLIADLAAERPIFMGTSTHAMVLTSCQYQVLPNGTPIIQSGYVLDPAPIQLPSGQIVAVGLRMLRPDEMRAMFAAEIEITPR